MKITFEADDGKLHTFDIPDDARVSESNLCACSTPKGPEPIPLIGSVLKILADRHGCCEGCGWPQEVCEYCLRPLDTDGVA